MLLFIATGEMGEVKAASSGTITYYSYGEVWNRYKNPIKWELSDEGVLTISGGDGIIEDPNVYDLPTTKQTMGEDIDNKVKNSCLRKG